MNVILAQVPENTNNIDLYIHQDVDSSVFYVVHTQKNYTESPQDV